MPFKFKQAEITIIKAAYLSGNVNLDKLASILGKPRSARTAICVEANKLGLTDMHRSKHTVLRGDKSPQWKADAAIPASKRQRARNLYSLGPCEKCSEPATDRRHKDSNTGNNKQNNI